ncbi:hypothetical protein PENTCL1PPCAC_24385, partial [Pristionchus entomophagus]
ISMILATVSIAIADDLSNELRGKWTVLSDNGTPCIMMYAQIDLNLSYMTDDDSLAEAGTIRVPAESTTDKSSCYEKVPIGDDFIVSQVLQLNLPENEGWNVRIAFTQDGRLGVHSSDYALYQVTVTANYSSMADVFVNAPKGHTHTYYSVIDFIHPPLIANDEFTKVGDSISCSVPQTYPINEDPHHGPAASVTLSNLQMQAYMSNSDAFGKRVMCPEDQNDLDTLPIIVASIIGGLALFTVISYFVYRSRLPTDILNITEQEFGEEHEVHHEGDISHLTSHHDNYGFHEEEHRF